MKVPMCFVCCIVNRYNMGRIVNGTILAEVGARPNIQSTTFNLSFCLKANQFKYLNVLNTWGNKLLLSIYLSWGGFSGPNELGTKERGRGGRGEAGRADTHSTTFNIHCCPIFEACLLYHHHLGWNSARDSNGINSRAYLKNASMVEHPLIHL